jgi:hypothetical protein
MTEERHNPSLAEMTHAEFEALLAEAIDGLLGPAELARFRAHGSSCRLCAPALALAEQGRTWLRALPELEPPAYLVQKILNVTSEVAPQAVEEKPAREWSWSLRPAFRAVLQPRFGMSFAMAFFSIMLILNVAGVQFSDLKDVDLRPSAVRSNVVKGYYETTGRVTRYYENLRFVYEVQSTLRDLRNAASSQDEPASQPSQDQQQKDQQQPRPDSDTSESPRENDKREKNERYSLDRPAIQLARAPQYESVLEDRRDA